MPEIKKTVTNMKMVSDGLFNKLDMAEERIYELENPWKQKSKENEDWKKKKDQNVNGLWDNCKRCNVSVMGIPKEKRKEQKTHLKQ